MAHLERKVRLGQLVVLELRVELVYEDHLGPQEAPEVPDLMVSLDPLEPLEWPVLLETLEHQVPEEQLEELVHLDLPECQGQPDPVETLEPVDHLDHREHQEHLGLQGQLESQEAVEHQVPPGLMESLE